MTMLTTLFWSFWAALNMQLALRAEADGEPVWWALAIISVALSLYQGYWEVRPW